MKKIGKLCLISLCYLTIVISISGGCKKNVEGTINSSLPELTTDSVTIVGVLTAQSGGTVMSISESDIIDKGVCFSVNAHPTILDSKVSAGSGPGNFTVFISLYGLVVGKTCFVRAYATN